MVTGAEVAAAYDQIEAVGAHVFGFDELVAQSVRGLAAHADGAPWVAMRDDTTERNLDLLLAEAGRTWDARRVCEDAIGTINREDLGQFDAAIGVTQGCLRLLGRRIDTANVPDDVAYVVSTLGVRAQATCHEISALLRAGFAEGGRARWRTLHEVAVVSSVLSLGNRYTASRFKHHRWVMLARDLDHEEDAATWYDGPSPQAMRRRLVKRFGEAYSGKYGWASPVTRQAINVSKPQFHDLERVARLATGHRPRVKRAHHSVHVDSLSGIGLLNADGILHAGARLAGCQPIVWQSVHALAEATDSLIAVWQRYDSVPVVAACRTYADRMLSELEIEIARRSEDSL